MNTIGTTLDLIGNTPLVRLQRLPGDTSNIILAKLEGNNPAGSVKDRPAISMIQQAEARGDIKPGDRLIEASPALRHQRSSEVIRGHQRSSSEVVRVHQRPSEDIKGHQRASNHLRK
jgi:hypothetical protein